MSLLDPLHGDFWVWAGSGCAVFLAITASCTIRTCRPESPGPMMIAHPCSPGQYSSVTENNRGIHQCPQSKTPPQPGIYHTHWACCIPYLGLAERINFFFFFSKKPRNLCLDLQGHYWVLCNLEAWLQPLWMSSGCEEGGQT